ncbi:MAG TPA: ATP-binding protein [bacterium]|jgi:two-component system sensor histidine kinase/response regulator|nr:ATP-binding protein [bacterium]
MVDDEARNLLSLEAVLGGLDQDLVRAGSGKEALRLLEQEDFSVVLLDVHMPVMDGIETADLIRTRERSRCTPIIFLTADERSPSQVSRGYESGAVEYLIKPFVPDVLRQKVKVFIELFQKTEEIRCLNVELRDSNAGLEERVFERTKDLELRSQDLARSNQDLAQFAAAASHDLQEPLRTINTYLQLLSRDSPERFTAEDRETIGIVIDSARRMRQLINDLLSFSQVGIGGQAPVAVDCGLLVDQVLGQLKEVIDEKKAEVTLGPLPALRAEPALLGQVFQNLIGNALKFCGDGAPVVRVGAADNGVEWVFSVADQGIGIEADQFDKVFKLFSRLHSRDEYPGNGLGLSLCKKIVERHAGRIWLESRFGRGTTFFFSIPHKG